MTLESFSSCTLTPEESSPSLTKVSDTRWKTSSFYVDSSGRSIISIPLRLQCPSKEVLESLIATRCFDSLLKKNDGSDETKGQEEEKGAETEGAASAPSTKTLTTFNIEAKVTLTFGTGEAITASVEDLVIESASREEKSIVFRTEIVVRVARSEGDRFLPGDASRVKTNLEITAVLVMESQGAEESSSSVDDAKALDIGGFPALGQPPALSKVRKCRLTPIEVSVTLTHALSITVRSVPGQLVGETFVSLTMHHSNSHSESVTITNIALHPGHSSVIENRPPTERRSSGAGANLLADMSKIVRWSYADQCDPNLPLVIQRHESHSTIIKIDATEDRRVRQFSCPISVDAMVGAASHRCNVVAASDVRWATSRAPHEGTDTFRIDMSVTEEAKVFTPVTVHLDITNSSNETRDVMVLVESNSETAGAEKMKALKKAAIAEKAGQKFGVWGLQEDWVPDLASDAKELLTVDVSIVVGDLKSNASKRAELRFIPLREGTINIPSLRLFDRRRSKWYSAGHNMKLVVK